MYPLIALTALHAGLVAAVWPVPSHYTNGSTVLWIDGSVGVTYSQPQNVRKNERLLMQDFTLTSASRLKLSSYVLSNPGAPNSGREMPQTNITSQAVVETAIQNAHDTILTKNFVPWRFYPRMTNFEPPADGAKTFISNITLQQNATDPPDLARPTDGELNEAYTLDVSSEGKVLITANSSVGLAWGLNTFTQLFYAHSKGGAYTALAPVHIEDAPKFVHRGINFDVSRNYYPIQAIYRTIDGLNYNKMNRLHLHATDAQSWPLEIPALPELAEKGAYAPGLTYSASDLASIQQYGALRGVQVYVEIDMPGHTSSIAYSHPDLIAAFNEQPDWQPYAAEPPSGTLKLNSSAVYDFLDTLFDDLFPRVAPYTSYFHSGGDEVKYQAYTLDDTVQSNSTSVIQPLLQKFVDHVHGKIRDAGLTPFAWEELLVTYNLTLGKDVILQSWTSDMTAAQIVNQGYKAIVGNYEYWYLDCGHGQFVNFEVGASSQTFYPYTDYCDPYKNWRLIYSYDPLNMIPENASHLILGGEVHVWSEQIDDFSLDGILWPRGSAAAEVLWSGAKDPVTNNNRSQIEAAPRLSEMRERLVARGLRPATVQMPFCTQGSTEQCVILNANVNG